MPIKTRFMVGAYLTRTDDTFCTACLLELDELTPLVEDIDYIPIFFDSELDYRAFCFACEAPIGHSLTDDGREYERSLELDTCIYGPLS